MTQKNINTLVDDIFKVIEKNGGWDETVSAFFADGMKATVDQRFAEPSQERGTLRMSNLGKPCKRQLWYSVNVPDGGETLRPQARLKFLYGDILEQLLLSLAIAAGHKVEGMQDEVEIEGIKGHRDCVIDGMTVDIKSASPYSFQKFKDHKLLEDDPFGYISQLSSYVYAAKDDPLVTDKTQGAFLAIDKVNGNICLDVYDLSSQVAGKKQEVLAIKALAVGSIPPRGFDDAADGKSGNRKLGVACSYCSRKYECWQGLRTFLYSSGPRFLTHVAREPDVPEVEQEEEVVE